MLIMYKWHACLGSCTNFLLSAFVRQSNKVCMIGTPGSYFEKEEKFLRECVRKQHAKENEECFFIIASSSRYVCIGIDPVDRKRLRVKFKPFFQEDTSFYLIPNAFWGYDAHNSPW